MPEFNLPKEFLRLLKPRLPDMLAALRRFVIAESPSLEKAAADRCCGLISASLTGHRSLALPGNSWFSDITTPSIPPGRCGRCPSASPLEELTDRAPLT